MQQHSTLGPSVSGRAIYSKIAVSHANQDIFSDWFRDKQRKLSLVEGKDFVTTSVSVAGTNRKHIENIVKIEGAKGMAEIATANRGLELATYLKHYPLAETITEGPDQADKVDAPETKAVGGVGALFTPLQPTHSIAEPKPAPLSPAQQLLAEVQKLVDAEQKRKDEHRSTARTIEGLRCPFKSLGK